MKNTLKSSNPVIMVAAAVAGYLFAKAIQSVIKNSGDSSSDGVATIIPPPKPPHFPPDLKTFEKNIGIK